jgi:uncharacterized protein YecT (DUF1311 family)
MALTALVLSLMLQGGPRGAVQAAESDGPACVRDGNTLQLNACAAQDLSAEEARMRHYVEMARTRAEAGDARSGPFGSDRTHQAAWLEASQRTWEAYADIRCAGVFDQWKGGTIRILMITGCRIEATRQRTHDIWTDHLTYADSTPPVLPEPVMTVFEEQEMAVPQR